MSDPVRVARGRIAGASSAGASPAVLDELRRDLTFAKAERHLQEALDANPPRTEKHLRTLAEMLDGAR